MSPAEIECHHCHKKFAVLELRDEPSQWYILDQESATTPRYCPFCGTLTAKEILRLCSQGQQWCHICPKADCGDNTNLDLKK